MKHYAVIGMPVEHSRSPEIYEALFKKHGVEADFIRLPVSTEQLPNIRSITRELSGFAVTMPHKRNIIKYLDSIDISAKNCGAVNIVERRGDSLIGHNTDGAGLVDALLDEGFSPAGKRALIMGRGGAALSAACALEASGCSVCLLVRSFSNGNMFREAIIGNFFEEAGLFVNASPLGMSGAEDYSDFRILDAAKPKMIFDMVYRNDGETKLIQEAKRRGLICLDGRAMLYKQALRAFQIFTGIRA